MAVHRTAKQQALGKHRQCITNHDCSCEVDAGSTTAGSICSGPKHSADLSEVVTTCPCEDLVQLGNWDRNGSCIPRPLVRDLASLHSTIDRQLQAALLSLEQADLDIAQALSMTCAEAQDWVGQTTDILSEFANNVQEIASHILPSIQVAARKKKDYAVSSLLGVAQNLIDCMSHDAKVVLCNYIALLDHVRYLIDCIQVELDSAIAMSAEKHAHDAAPLAPQATAFSRVTCLKAALLQLENAASAMEPSSVFWDAFYFAGRSLTQMSSDASALRSCLLDSNCTTKLPEEFDRLCGVLEDFCEKYSSAH
mmetsp:Transcript_137768/g.384150  ORF Transcript_137768/g.384150 Transcript_137768/m.384150 type:complete len:309 (-) Transcript_137768:454-1380(-)|eukprot:CAMPEP_0179023902 /NCGR_PEP_ID=MMETSP0796-20121207/7177_1 /TAXON_ID=73915 /ORGANISM="Pyrodinium bahamense, Strain pbaha01" /LENGTH=308 /DNA_ID=CAMNT_0020719843 /DNA_START=35 /DNA_END=961 /DNA_ORIENTATION=-